MPPVANARRSLTEGAEILDRILGLLQTETRHGPKFLDGSDFVIASDISNNAIKRDFISGGTGELRTDINGPQGLNLGSLLGLNLRADNQHGIGRQIILKQNDAKQFGAGQVDFHRIGKEGNRSLAFVKLFDRFFCLNYILD